MQFVKTPVFLGQNLFDTNQIYTQLLAPHGNASLDFRTFYGKRFMASIQDIINSEVPHGMWVPSCENHCGDINMASQTVVDTGYGGPYHYGDALRSWFFGIYQYPRILIDACIGDGAAPACNPTC